MVAETRRISPRSIFLVSAIPGDIQFRIRPLTETAELAAQRVQLLSELAGEFVERPPPRADELELPLDERDRLADDARAFVVARRVHPAIAERGARLARLGEGGQLLEREAEEVTQAQQLDEPGHVGLAVEAVGPLRARRRCAEQAELLVVADRARRYADAFGDFADPEGGAGGSAAHIASSARAGSVGETSAGVVTTASRWWYLPPRSAEATAATR